MELGLDLRIAGRKEAQKALTGTADDVKAIGAAAEEVQEKSGRAQRALSGIGRTVRSGARAAGGAMLSLAGSAARVGAVAVPALAGIGAAGFVVGVKVAAGAEQAQISFETMLGSGEKARSFLGELQAFAAKTPFEFTDLQTAASSLISVGIESDKVIPIMTSLGNATSGMGTGAEGVKRATVALQQMSAAGKITGEDLNQLRDAGVPVFDLLTAATGKTTAEIANMAAKGKLGREELDQLMKSLETGNGLERFTGLMDKQSLSLSGRWSTFLDTLHMGLGTVAAPWLPVLGTGLDHLVSVTQRFLSIAAAGSAKLAAATPGWVAAFTGGLNVADIKSRAVAAGLGSVQLKAIPVAAIVTRIGRFLHGAAVFALDLVTAIRSGAPSGEGVANAAQRIGSGLRAAAGFAHDLLVGLSGGKDSSAALAGAGEKIGSTLRSAGAAIGGADWGGFFSAIAGQLPAINSGMSVLGTVTGFLSQHLDTLAKWMPVIIGAFIVMKVAQSAQAVAMVASIPLRIAETGATVLNAAAMRQLAWAINAANGNTRAGILVRIRDTVVQGAQRVATLATAVATRVASAATRGAALAQRVLNAAMRANPIGLVITAILLLVSGIVWFATKTKAGRAATQFLWEGLKTLWGWAKKTGGAIKVWLVDKIVGLISKGRELIGVLKNIPGVGTLISGAESIAGAVLPGRASGGPVSAGQPYVVGERRPELFVPHADGTVLPRVPTSGDVAGSMADAVSSGRPLVVQVQVDRRTLAETTVDGLRVMAARK